MTYGKYCKNMNIMDQSKVDLFLTQNNDKVDPNQFNFLSMLKLHSRGSALFLNGHKFYVDNDIQNQQDKEGYNTLNNQVHIDVHLHVKSVPS